MAPLHHREPGPVGAVLAALAEGSDLRVELIADGRHIADDFLQLLRAASASSSLILVSDAMAAAGMPDGDYRLGELDVLVRGGAARLENGALTGSTSTLADIVRRAIAARALPAAQAHRLAGANPAQALGLAGAGQLREGAWADLLLLDSAGAPRKAMRRGKWLD